MPRLHSSFILLANLRDSGLTYSGKPYEGVYAAAFHERDGGLAGIAAHYWNGNVVLQAPAHAGALAQAVTHYSRREIDGLLGPWQQVRAARAALQLEARPTRHESEEILYALDIDEMLMPDALEEGRFLCRVATDRDLPELLELSVVENAEMFGEEDTPVLRDRLMEWLVRSKRERNLFLLEDRQQIVAMSLFHGRVERMVEIGGVFTLPQFRGMGCARSVVAGSLLLAGDQGIDSAVLFTGVGNVSAQRAYAALGFKAIGDYGIVLFARPE